MATAEIIDLTSSGDSVSRHGRVGAAVGSVSVKQEKRSVVTGKALGTELRDRVSSNSHLLGSTRLEENTRGIAQTSTRMVTHDNDPKHCGDSRKVTSIDDKRSIQSRDTHSADPKSMPRAKNLSSREASHHLPEAAFAQSMKHGSNSGSQALHTARQSGSLKYSKNAPEQGRQRDLGHHPNLGSKRSRVEEDTDFSATTKRRRFDSQSYTSKHSIIGSPAPLTTDRLQTKQNIKRSYLGKNVIDLTGARDVPELIVIDDDGDNKANVTNTSRSKIGIKPLTETTTPGVFIHDKTKAVAATHALTSRVKQSVNHTGQKRAGIKTETLPVPSQVPTTEHVARLGKGLSKQDSLAVPPRPSLLATPQHQAHCLGHSGVGRLNSIDTELGNQAERMVSNTRRPWESMVVSAESTKTGFIAALKDVLDTRSKSRSPRLMGAPSDHFPIAQPLKCDVHEMHPSDTGPGSSHHIAGSEASNETIGESSRTAESHLNSTVDSEMHHSLRYSHNQVVAGVQTPVQGTEHLQEHPKMPANSSTDEQGVTYNRDNGAIPPALDATDRKNSPQPTGSTDDTFCSPTDVTVNEPFEIKGNATAEASHVLSLLGNLTIKTKIKNIIEYVCRHKSRIELFPQMLSEFENRKDLQEASASLHNSGKRKFGDQEWRRITSKLGVGVSDISKRREQPLLAVALSDAREVPRNPRTSTVNETPSPDQYTGSQKQPAQTSTKGLNIAMHAFNDTTALQVDQTYNMEISPPDTDLAESTLELSGSNEVERALGRQLEELSNDSEYWTRALLKRARCSKRHPIASTDFLSAKSPFSFSAMKAMETTSASARNFGRSASFTVECANTKKKLSFTTPTTSYKVRDTMPAYSHYVQIKRNFLSLNEKTMISWPYFGDDYNEINREKGHDPEHEIGEVYNLDILYRPEKLVHMLQGQRYDTYVEAALTDLGMSWTDLLHFALDLSPDVGTSIEAQQALRQRDTYCESVASRQTSRTAIVLSSIPESDSKKVALAALLFDNFQKMTRTSLWHVVRRHMYDQVGKEALEHEKRTWLHKFTCRVCLRFQCPYHGEIRELVDHDGAASNNAATDSAFMDIINPEVINSRDRIEFRPASVETLPQPSVESTANKAHRTVQHLVQRNLINDVNSAGPFYPCHHPGTSCEDAQCTCFESRILCEKSCSCSFDCIRKFQGCSCSSEKRRKGQKMMCFDDDRCACLKTSRECDPDLCGACGVCDVLDSVYRHDPDILIGRCRNASVQRGVSKHTIVGKSLIAGLGLYTTEPIEQHEFVGEYKGEIISHDEAERRWTVYQHQGRHYIFSLNAAQEVDGTYYGNKTRFINHARPGKFNLYPKTITVNSVHRVALYAVRKIIPGEELFFDYGPMFPDELVGGKKNKKKAAARADNLKDYYDVEQAEDEHGTLHARKVTMTGRKDTSRSKRGNARARHIKSVRIGDTNTEPAPQALLDNIVRNEEDVDRDSFEGNPMSSEAADAGNAGQRLYSYNISEEDDHDISLAIPEPEEDDDFEPEANPSEDEDEVEAGRDGGRSRYASREVDRGVRDYVTLRLQTATISPQKKARSWKTTGAY